MPGQPPSVGTKLSVVEEADGDELAEVGEAEVGVADVGALPLLLPLLDTFDADTDFRCALSPPPTPPPIAAASTTKSVTITAQNTGIERPNILLRALPVVWPSDGTRVGACPLDSTSVGCSFGDDSRGAV